MFIDRDLQSLLIGEAFSMFVESKLLVQQLVYQSFYKFQKVIESGSYETSIET